MTFGPTHIPIGTVYKMDVDHQSTGREQVAIGVKTPIGAELWIRLNNVARDPVSMFSVDPVELADLIDYGDMVIGVCHTHLWSPQPSELDIDQLGWVGFDVEEPVGYIWSCWARTLVQYNKAGEKVLVWPTLQ
jgi:proteasome lid subunit RPN8/RPN11